MSFPIESSNGSSLRSLPSGHVARSGLRSLHLPLVGWGTLLVAWQLASLTGAVNPALLPSLGQTAKAAWGLVATGSIMPDLAATLTVVAAGFSVAAIAGTALGIAMGSNRVFYDASITIVDFFRSVPVTALYPVFVFTVGIDRISKISMVAVACLWVTALNSAYGVLHAKPLRAQMSYLYGATPSQIFVVRLYDAAPQIAVGLRVALSYAMIVTVLCEMFMGARYGLGQRLTEAYTTYAMPDMYALVGFTGIVGFALNKLFLKLEQRVVHWAGQ